MSTFRQKKNPKGKEMEPTTTELSTILNPTTPLTLKSGSTTPHEAPFGDIDAVLMGWKSVPAVERMKASISSSVVALVAVNRPVVYPLQAGAATNRRADLTASRIAKMSKSVAKKLGSIRGASNGLLEFIDTEPP